MRISDVDGMGWLSRPIRLAAELCGEQEAALEHLFLQARVLIRLEDDFANVQDARETFLFAVNQVIRFCPNVSIYAPNLPQLVDACRKIAARVYRRAYRIDVENGSDLAGFSAVITVGTQILNCSNSVTVNSTGWVARVATAGAGAQQLFWARGASNPIGALAAGCLGAAHSFRFLVGLPLVTPSTELSLFSHEFGEPGSLSAGPELPVAPLWLESFLIGCGAVANGWVYTVKRLPIVGHIEAVDRQSLRIENLAPYVCSGREWLQKPKAKMVASLLAPAIAVSPRPEEWELFKIRLRYGTSVPKLIVNGLDNVETRHSVQRLWPDMLIDMGAGGASGLTSQVIVKPRPSDSICLLGALDRPANEIGWAERAARETGLPLERILQEPTTEITESDIAKAPEDKRPTLELARRQAQRLCGRISDQNLRFEGHNANFAPAVPFVTGFSGVIGAAETMKWLMAPQTQSGFHFQYSFGSGRAQRHNLKCSAACECHIRR